MFGASECMPLLNCTDDDIIAAPGDVNSCSCTSFPNGTSQCTTTLQPYYVRVHGKLRIKVRTKNAFRHVQNSDQINTDRSFAYYRIRIATIQQHTRSGDEIDNQ